MVRKLVRDALTSQLASARQLEDEARAEGDELGAMQFAYRRHVVEEELAQLGAAPDRMASVALFFGGEAVLGSIGVKAEFAGKAIEDFQDLVDKRFASETIGELARRGRVPGKASSELMVTGVARGSFGFVLEEAAEYEPTVHTALVDTVEQVAQLVDRLASPDESRFEEAIQDLDPRVLGAARDFFKTLDNFDASVRIVEGETDVSIGRADVQRAFTRTNALEVEDREDEEMEGRLYVLPHLKKFEFVLRPDYVVTGNVNAEIADALSADDQLFANPVGKLWRARFRIREVRRPLDKIKLFYTLTGLIRELPEPPQDGAIQAPQV